MKVFGVNEIAPPPILNGFEWLLEVILSLTFELAALALTCIFSTPCLEFRFEPIANPNPVSRFCLPFDVFENDMLGLMSTPSSFVDIPTPSDAVHGSEPDS